MVEIIAAILGAFLSGILAGYLTWRYGRYRPNYIVCDEEFRAELTIGGPLKNWHAQWNTSNIGARFSLLIGLPKTQILFKEKAVEELTLITLILRNTSDKPIDNPSIQIRLDEKAMVLGCDASFRPERIRGKAGSDEPESTSSVASFDKNIINITIDSLFPYNLNKEVLILDVICSGKAGKPDVSGQGKFNDGTAWATKYEMWEETQRTTDKWLRMLGLFLISGFALYSVYLISYILNTVVPMRSNYRIEFFIQSPQLIIYIALFIAILLYSGYLILYRGWQFRFSIPFQKKRLIIKAEYYLPDSKKSEKHNNKT